MSFIKLIELGASTFNAQHNESFLFTVIENISINGKILIPVVKALVNERRVLNDIEQHGQRIYKFGCKDDGRYRVGKQQELFSEVLEIIDDAMKKNGKSFLEKTLPTPRRLTFLLDAILNDDEIMVKILLQAGADINTQDKNGHGVFRIRQSSKGSQSPRRRSQKTQPRSSKQMQRRWQLDSSTTTNFKHIRKQQS